MGGPRFVSIPAERLLGELRTIGSLVVARGGSVVEGVQGREVFFDVSPPGGRAVVRVFTSLARGASEVRECGEDAVRLVVGVTVDGKFRPTESGKKILRTAPRTASDRVAYFLDRLRTAIREGYVRAKAVPACPACGSAMAHRARHSDKSSFWGCVTYPTCRGTRPIEQPKDGARPEENR